MFFLWEKLKKIREVITWRGEDVAGFNFACSTTELQKSHLSKIIQQDSIYLIILLYCLALELSRYVGIILASFHLRWW